jgi:hypothetical protein
MVVIRADNVTGTPTVGGALPSSVTVAVADCPPVTGVGAMATDNTDAGTTVTMAFVTSPFAAALIVAVATVATPGVLIRNVADVCP